MLMTCRGACTEHPFPQSTCKYFMRKFLKKVSRVSALLKISHPPTAISIRQITNDRRGFKARIEGNVVVLGAHLREPRVLRQGLLGPARWVTREVLAVTPMVFPTRREAAHNFCYNLCVKGLLCWYGLLACDGSRTAS